MHKTRTPWPLHTRTSYIASFQELRRRYPGMSVRSFCAASEIPYSTFSRWWSCWRRGRKHLLVNRSRRPKSSPSALPGAVLDIIRQAHRKLGLGVKRIHAYLTQAGLITCSLSSVYRVLKRAGALVRRPRKPTPHWKRYAKAVPGERAQMDLMYLAKGFQLTLIDDCSRVLAATLLTKRTCSAVCAALPALLASLPFSLRCIQTDNGSEFGRLLTALLRRLGIRHVRIRPRTPRLNGKVERVQRTIREELWEGLRDDSQTWEAELQAFVRHYNEARLHSALGYRPPLVYALERLPQAQIPHMS